MKMWGQSRQHQNAVTGGDEFDAAAARVSAEVAEEPGPGAAAVEPEPETALVIRVEWAETAARLCFVPPARLVHPAYALEDREAAAIAPQMQAFLQAVADKYAPAALGRVASKYPEFFDLAAALGVLYWQKWRHVSRIQKLEAEERAAAASREKETAGAPAPVPIRARAGERDAETGALII